MPLQHSKLAVAALAALIACPALASAHQAAHPLAVTDPLLQRGLDRTVGRLGLTTLAREQRIAIALVDLSDPDLSYAAVNGDAMMYAASLPKIAILLGAFDALQDGEIPDTPRLRTQMERMIRVSDNAAATDVLNQVGFDGVADTLTDRTNGLYDALKGGLWVGKAYGRNDYWERDPIANLSHGATARQVARYFLMLDHGELVSESASSEMKSILGEPGIRHKFVRGLERRPGARIYRKSGTWRDYHADAALVERDDACYVAVGLVHDADGERILQRLIVGLDDLVRGRRPAAAGGQR